MKVFFHGKFAEDYGPEHIIEADSVADAVTGLTRQIGFYADRMIEDRPVANIVGHATIESLNERPEEIHIVPAIFGGKGGIKVLIGAALIGFVLSNPFGWAVGGMVLNTMFGLGVGLAISGLSEMFIKSPSLSKESDPEASQYLGLSNNTTKLGTLRSYSMGRIKMTSPHLLALNVDSNDLVIGEFPA